MILKGALSLILMTTFSLLPALADTTSGSEALADFQKRASRFHGVISLPKFETTTNEIRASVRQTITNGNQALDKIGALTASKITFENVIRALDDIGYEAGLTANRLSVMKETSMDAAMRDAATDAIKELEEWSVGLEYREDVFRAYFTNV